jgi:hypothetical protein
MTRAALVLRILGLAATMVFVFLAVPVASEVLADAGARWVAALAGLVGVLSVLVLRCPGRVVDTVLVGLAAVVGVSWWPAIVDFASSWSRSSAAMPVLIAVLWMGAFALVLHVIEADWSDIGRALSTRSGSSSQSSSPPLWQGLGSWRPRERCRSSWPGSSSRSQATSPNESRSELSVAVTALGPPPPRGPTTHGPRQRLRPYLHRRLSPYSRPAGIPRPATPPSE